MRRGQLLHGENMPLFTVVIAQHDHSIAQELANDLHAHFAEVAVTENAMELRTLLLRHAAQVAVLDLELVNLDEVHQLANSFEELTIVCTHRAPDEQMWIAALDAGAVEFCHAQDVRSILRASNTAAKRNIGVS
jgi:DNA-binding NtrC family response regulator